MLDSTERTLRANGLQVLALPAARAVAGADGAALPASYCNFYIANEAVIVPFYGFPEDADARARNRQCLSRPRGGRPARPGPAMGRRSVSLRHASSAGHAMTAASLSIGIVQCALGGTREENVARVEALVRDAASDGAQVILTPELFEGPYFPQTEDEHAFDLAAPLDGHPTVARMQALAAELGVVLPVSWFERAGQNYYNSLVTIDSDGAQLGVYRKSHIPDGPGYEEKFYFRPGDTGFRVWNTRHGASRRRNLLGSMVPRGRTEHGASGRRGAALPDGDRQRARDAPRTTRSDRWQRAMVGHAVVNAMPIAAANRIGTEGALTFYGSSFVCDHRGELRSRARARGRRRGARSASTAMPCADTERTGASSATDARTCTARLTGDEALD